MMEKSKTLILTFLVVLSLVQSYFLSYSMPNFEPIQKSESSYVKTEEMGPEEKIENLVFPEQMVLHLGGGKHTVFSPDYIFYKEIFKRLQGRKFDGFQRTSTHLLDLSRIRNEDPGIELVYGQGVPVTLLRKVMQIQGDPEFGDEMINRIWIFTSDDKETVRALFFSSKNQVVYEATKADLTVQDVKQHVEFGQAWDSYRLLYDQYYLPDKPLNMVQIEVPYEVFTAEQMQHNLFFDPSTTRNIKEKDGSEIYTDSKRSLQVRPEHQWVTYSDPVARVEGANDVSENVLSAVQFVNQHGGWNGTHRLSISPVQVDGTEVVFQQYYGGYPIVTDSMFRFGNIRLSVQQGVVTSYQRSLIYLDDRASLKQLRTLQGGDELAMMFKRYLDTTNNKVQWVFPAYRPFLTDKVIRLIPTWAVRLEDGSMDYLK
ncbi:YycH family regulatory protein [Paenibacillus sp. GCM10027629]|uniref:YycH family regulatory protein n=1 Tax=Paenibacillus sp. GCM10027629 TaxID=3273414 RepID=UPI0036436BE9